MEDLAKDREVIGIRIKEVDTNKEVIVLWYANFEKILNTTMISWGEIMEASKDVQSPD